MFALLHEHFYFVMITIVVILYQVMNKYPLLFRKRIFLGRKGFAQIIGHRGSREEGLPENTIASFKDAIKNGAEVIELGIVIFLLLLMADYITPDVWLTKDNQVVVFHDDNLHRMTCGKHASDIAMMNFSDLPEIGPDSDKQQHRTHLYEARHWQNIPRLHDVLQELPVHVPLIIEFKMDSPVLIAEVMRMVRDSEREREVFWFSLKDNINSKLRKFDPRIPTLPSQIGVLKVLLLHYTCLLPFVPLDDPVFGITLNPVSNRASTFLQVHSRSVLGHIGYD